MHGAHFHTGERHHHAGKQHPLSCSGQVGNKRFSAVQIDLNRFAEPNIGERTDNQKKAGNNGSDNHTGI